MSSDTATLTPTRGKKRSHNDENLSPSKTNSPAKARHAIGIASIRSFFAPASLTEEEEESAEFEFDQTINSSPQKKLRLTNSIASTTTSASFITSTPKKTPKRPSKGFLFSSLLFLFFERNTSHSFKRLLTPIQITRNINTEQELSCPKFAGGFQRFAFPP